MEEVIAVTKVAERLRALIEIELVEEEAGIRAVEVVEIVTAMGCKEEDAGEEVVGVVELFRMGAGIEVETVAA